MRKPEWMLKPLDSGGYASGCLNCGPQPIELSMNACLAIGFGSVTVSRNGEILWSGDDANRTLAMVEAKAALDPDNDWRVIYEGPLSEAEYQRQEGRWLLVRKGLGFA